jgi:large subunit ribosomal protein L25
LESLNLKSALRTKTGNGPARVLRRQGRIPAILYGPTTTSEKISVDASELEKLIKQQKGAQSLINLLIDDDSRTVMIKDIQVDPLKRTFLHADFYEVNLERKLRVKIPVEVVGLAQGVEMGGLLQVIRRELEVFCLPNAIPESIKLDVTDLQIGDAIHVNDIELGQGVDIPADVNFTVVTVIGGKTASDESDEGEEADADEVLETEEPAA